mmetsp:Transcript_22852/g.40460  ORF Transcript_22852/g.40460 Transcript_22852/m.40460 type:complete len:276 (-) Transcript_22852:263-1090(-)
MCRVFMHTAHAMRVLHVFHFLGHRRLDQPNASAMYPLIVPFLLFKVSLSKSSVCSSLRRIFFFVSSESSDSSTICLTKALNMSDITNMSNCAATSGDSSTLTGCCCFDLDFDLDFDLGFGLGFGFFLFFISKLEVDLFLSLFLSRSLHQRMWADSAFLLLKALPQSPHLHSPPPASGSGLTFVFFRRCPASPATASASCCGAGLLRCDFPCPGCCFCLGASAPSRDFISVFCFALMRLAAFLWFWFPLLLLLCCFALPSSSPFSSLPVCASFGTT